MVREIFRIFVAVYAYILGEMNSDTVVIIGAGLGGLECGYILAKCGFKVVVLERESQLGGCLQTFRRGYATFDTGFHYIGGLSEGESLNRLFTYFDLMGLPWYQLDRDCFDEVVIGNRSYAFANGHDRFVETLAAHFPAEREGLKRYTSFLRQVGDHIFDSLLPKSEEEFLTQSLFSRSAYEFLNEYISSPTLKKILSGTSLKMELNAPTLPLYTFAQINDSYIRSAWRLKGGGSQIAEHLAESIRQMGGEVRTNAAVTLIREADGKVAGVELNGGEEFVGASWVISSVHPAYTISLVGESQKMRRAYRHRISRLENTFGMFTANIRLKPDMVPYMNRNIYVHRAQSDPWHIDLTDTESVLVNYPVPEEGKQTVDSIDLLTPMSWKEVEKWSHLPVGRRGTDYVTCKEMKAQQCLGLVKDRLPELESAIDHIYTSSPLSYHSYIASAEGCAYGIRKDYNNPMGTVLTPRTPLPGLLLTGQSLNLHGILGVSMTSLFTCAEIVGREKIIEEIGLNK